MHIQRRYQVKMSRIGTIIYDTFDPLSVREYLDFTRDYGAEVVSTEILDDCTIYTLSTEPMINNISFLLGLS